MSERSKEYLKKRGLKNPPIDSGISGGGDAPRTYVSDVMDEWNPYLTKQTTSLTAEVDRLKSLLSVRDLQVETLIEQLTLSGIKPII